MKHLTNFKSDIAKRKPQMKKAIVFAAALAATPATAQTEAESFCESMAMLSEATAIDRMAGVQLHEMIATAQAHPWPEQDQEDIIIQIISFVYESNLRPADAYVLTYRTCVNQSRNQ